MATAIVFDLDDTLYLERDFVRSGFTAVDTWIRERFAISGFLERAWLLFERGRRRDIFDQVLPMLAIRPSPDLIDQLVRIYRGHAPAIRLAADAEESLSALRPRCRCALVTDGPRAPPARKVQALGLINRLQPVIYTDAFGRGMAKPHPCGFLAVQDELGLPACEFVYIADNPAKDFIAPRRLGWKTIRVRRPEGLYTQLCAEPDMEADQTITSLRELDFAEL